jgi:transcriptional regulator with XRE-family HTH domain
MAHMQTSVLSERELLSYQADLRSQIFRQVHRTFRHLKERGFTQRKFAKRLGMHASQLSRILKGENDLRLETLSDLARALECRIEVRIVPLDTDAARKEEQPIIFNLHPQNAPANPYGTSATIKRNDPPLSGAGVLPFQKDTWAGTGTMV